MLSHCVSYSQCLHIFSSSPPCLKPQHLTLPPTRTAPTFPLHQLFLGMEHHPTRYQLASCWSWWNLLTESYPDYIIEISSWPSQWLSVLVFLFYFVMMLPPFQVLYFSANDSSSHDSRFENRSMLKWPSPVVHNLLDAATLQ